MSVTGIIAIGCDEAQVFCGCLGQIAAAGGSVRLDEPDSAMNPRRLEDRRGGKLHGGTGSGIPGLLDAGTRPECRDRVRSLQPGFPGVAEPRKFAVPESRGHERDPAAARGLAEIQPRRQTTPTRLACCWSANARDFIDALHAAQYPVLQLRMSWCFARRRPRS